MAASLGGGGRLGSLAGCSPSMRPGAGSLTNGCVAILDEGAVLQFRSPLALDVVVAEGSAAPVLRRRSAGATIR